MVVRRVSLTPASSEVLSAMSELDITLAEALQRTSNYLTTWKQLTLKDVALDEIR